MARFVTAVVAMTAGLAAATCAHRVPSVDVPACPRVGSITYSKTVPDQKPFPRTQVDLCYSAEHLQIGFTAYDEVNFYFNASQGTNGDIWQYEVMEAFVYKGTDDPQTYLEFEVNPNNVTYQAFVYNPSKVRAEGAPFDHLFVSDPAADGFSATTKLDKPRKYWRSDVKIPLGLFNVDKGKARGTRWRMNFFRTVTSPQTYPDQELGAWSSPNKASFHITPYFGNVRFV
ncbi:carbohydrate-binding domain, family 9-like, subgroup [Purpureocillium lilacinum]|uniref:Carbohydrate-binding domain, family 9-like, subgroup n=1 Tax=Purpureocillium lilacinum TaxID=33203 RepID=A0A179HQL7_PURLI|nr:carbohydrate-binding domain, family 9-like, subgroup [Purpureocillium lilacinum]KAK4093953.1 hypothetical protein Purlil1_1444 [Purpureocillium lilacinum]OAQ92746.1 carbohydrate-binding domain, family 9-like, subgroup [Purpureocillium lilacinum]GJN82869.1 hypothetical protein PLIIFM63780_006414 [Purpureocillium lilacinum]